MSHSQSQLQWAKTRDRRRSQSKASQRRGSALVFSIVLVAGLLIVSAVAIDFGHINTSRSEIKRTSDAAALGACWELFDGVAARKSAAEVQSQIGDAAQSLASKNAVGTIIPSVNSDSDVEIGYYDLENPGTLDTSDPDKFNAVRVHVKQVDADQSGVPLFFGAVTGRNTQSLKSYSTAALFKQISGFHTPGDSGEYLDILPIALDMETWETVLAKSTQDVFTYENGTCSAGSDGYFECSLYPTGTGSPGNRGTVDIGGSNNSTSDLSRQILHGISSQDMVDFGRELEFDDNHELELNGDTGISAGIKDELASIIGQPRCIPIFSEVKGNGNNAMYTIIRWEGIRILEVKLTGPMKKKHVTIQPCPMVAKYATYRDSTIAESDFLFTPVMLVD